MPKQKDPGKYIELSIEHIGEGKFKNIFQKHMREIHKALMAYEEETGDKTASASMTSKLTISRMNGSDDFANIQFEFNTKTPRPKHTTNAIITGKVMLFNPNGDSLNDSDQMTLTYTRKGEKGASINKETGEVIEDDGVDPVVGQVGHA